MRFVIPSRKSRIVTSTSPVDIKVRAYWVLGGLMLGILLTAGRLFYWQIIKGPALAIAAQEQYERSVTTKGNRGSIYTSDGHLLVTNQVVYRLFLEPPLFTDNPTMVANSISSLLTPNIVLATDEKAQAEVDTKSVKQQLEQKLQDKNQKWLSLATNVTEEQKAAIGNLGVKGLGFEPYQRRYYPEASMAAHLTGFVGKNEQGQDIGYFGIEGALENELKSRDNTKVIKADALGREFLEHFDPDLTPQNGRDIVTTVRRDVQHIISDELLKGIEQYGGKSGEVLVMEPSTGKILGFAAYPSYDQEKFFEYNPELYKNPGLATGYEPGSTLKVLTVAAAIDSGMVSPDTVCSTCGAPRVFGKYTIKNWNEKYVPNVTVRDGLKNSDNTAMIFVAELLGNKRFPEYLKKFGISEKVNIELQEDTTTPFPTKWGPVEMATRSFGQGIITNSFQLVRAIGAIANRGKLMQPYIVDHVIDPSTGEKFYTQPSVIRQAVKPETAQTVTDMMVYAAQTRRDHWVAFDDTKIAGKTGTSQIADSGAYAEGKTIVSYVGFAPAEKPSFVMLVKIDEPSVGNLSSTTTAPLWYDIAEKLLLIL